MRAIPKSTIGLAAGLVLGLLPAGAQVHVLDDFTAAHPGEPNMTAQGLAFNYAQYTVTDPAQDPWTLNTSGSGTLNFAATGVTGSGNHLEGPAAVASLALPGWAGQDFVISGTFTLNTLGTGSNNSTVGFAFLGSDPFFTGDGETIYYKADLAVGTSNAGRLTVTKTGGGSGSFTSGGSTTFIPDVLFNGSTVELRVAGTYDEFGTLSIVLSAYDENGVHLGTRPTATDTSPLTGEYFGIRNRIGTGADVFDVDHHDFTVVPEPAAVAALFGGVALAAALLLRRRRRRR